MSPRCHARPRLIEPDPVGEASGIELVEITEGVIFAIERETDRRLYGVISAPDGEEAGLWAFQSTLRKDRVVRRTPLSHATHLLRGLDGSSLLYEGYHGWHLGAPRPRPRAIRGRRPPALPGAEA